MHLVSSIVEMQQLARQARSQGRRIGLVPTMGSLHEGHLSLIRIARKDCDLLVVSIFVNPTQFGQGEDYDTYPRDMDSDSRKCAGESVDIIFCPGPAEMYRDDRSTIINETAVSIGQCGAARPGHFSGVATVVAKLFNIVDPDLAVFGRKDAQQVAVIRRMARDLNFRVKIVAAPIVREPDGLALSSRNVYLAEEGRAVAGCLNEALDLAEELYGAGELDCSTICRHMIEHIEQRGGIPEYVEAVGRDTFAAVSTVTGPTLFVLAVMVGRTRLIDNREIG